MRKFIGILALTAFFGACSTSTTKPPEGGDVVVTPLPPIEPGQDWFKPAPMSRYQIMSANDGDYVKQLRKGTQIVTIEGIKDYQELKEEVASLHAAGVRVICYQSLSVEPWRDDIDQFPSKAKGAKMKGWNEWWSDTRTTSPAHPFWDARYVKLAEAGCDCVEDDNEVDPNDNGTGFPLSREEAGAANKRRADFAHSVGMCHIAKNNPSTSDLKAQNSDGVFIEEAHEYNEREDYIPWRDAKKFGAMVEYDEDNCAPFPGFSVQFHEGNDYFNAVEYIECL